MIVSDSYLKSVIAAVQTLSDDLAWVLAHAAIPVSDLAVSAADLPVAASFVLCSRDRPPFNRRRPVGGVSIVHVDSNPVGRSPGLLTQPPGLSYLFYQVRTHFWCVEVYRSDGLSGGRVCK